MNQTAQNPVLSVSNLCKSFSGKTVVDKVTFDVYAGEIIALVGENGAGKSTLKNMLCGLLKPTSGAIYIDGKQVTDINGFDYGISAVHQELSLFSSLSVAANICINDLPGKATNINWKMVNKIAKEQLEFLGANIDTSVMVDSLGMGEQQLIEIAKALLHSDKLLILDEPTTSLTVSEKEKLFKIMFNLKERGVAIIFISHFMDEILKVSDKFICLRDGQQVGGGYIKDITQKQLEEMMVGRTISESHIDIGVPSKEEKIKVENLSSYEFNNVSFSVKKGEILGISGLIGAGRTELVESIFGVRKSKGKIYIEGNQVKNVNVQVMKNNKISFVTEDRRNNGIFPNRSIRENLSAASIINFVQRKIKKIGFKDETKNALQMKKNFNISIPHIESRITSLSGGNQQKVIIGRWLANDPEIVILDEPTKGVDIGAKFDIHTEIADLAKKGAAVIIVSSDLPELMTLSHRILVMKSGHIVGSVNRNEFDPVKIISLAASSLKKEDVDMKKGVLNVN